MVRMGKKMLAKLLLFKDLHIVIRCSMRGLSASSCEVLKLIVAKRPMDDDWKWLRSYYRL